MRVVVATIAVLMSACLGSSDSVETDHASFESRVDDSCGELDALCRASNSGCDALNLFCGDDRDARSQCRKTERECKKACEKKDKKCKKSCKSSRKVCEADLPGDVLNACRGIADSCESAGAGCLSLEFFCHDNRDIKKECKQQEKACKEACPDEDEGRACKHSCKVQRNECAFKDKKPPKDDPQPEPEPTPDAGVAADAA